MKVKGINLEILWRLNNSTDVEELKGSKLKQDQHLLVIEQIINLIISILNYLPIEIRDSIHCMMKEIILAVGKAINLKVLILIHV